MVQYAIVEHFANNYFFAYSYNLPSLVVSLLLGVKGHRHPTSVESSDDVIVTEFVKIHA